eukprot:Ihof_evm1s1083 gene=Ihof_evmTU1s1083
MEFNTGDVAVDAALTQWMKWDQCEATRAQLMEFVEKKEVETLRKLLLQRMEFGTAGLRAAMGAGTARMNNVTIIQTAQ